MKTTSASFISRQFRVSKLAYLALLSVPILAAAQDSKDTKTTGVLNAPAPSISTKRSFPLRHADPRELADAITSLSRGRKIRADLAAGLAVSGISGDSEGCPEPEKAAQMARPHRRVSQCGQRCPSRRLPDAQSNSLIVNAPEATMKTIEGIIKQIDVLTTGGSTTHTFHLLHADAVELAVHNQ